MKLTQHRAQEGDLLVLLSERSLQFRRSFLGELQELFDALVMTGRRDVSFDGFRIAHERTAE